MSFYEKSEDTGGEKKWDRAEYADKARERSKQYRERQEQGGYVPKPDQSAAEAAARQQRLNIYEGLNKISIVPAGASMGKRGKGAGFYCEVCNLTFKDSIQYTDHLNSKQHLYASGIQDTTSRATLQEVQQRLEYLRQKKLEKEQSQLYDINKRIQERKKLEEMENQLRKERRKSKKIALREKAEKAQNGHDSIPRETSDSMESMMGFSGFGSTKT